MVFNLMKNASAKYQAPLCDVCSVESVASVLAASASGSISDWSEDPNSIDL